MATTIAAAAGYFKASIPRPTTKTSPRMLRIQFEKGSGLVFATTRVPAFVKCEPAASVPPRSAPDPRRTG